MSDGPKTPLTGTQSTGMFHTPPPVDREKSYLVEQSEQESYGTVAEENAEENEEEHGESEPPTDKESVAEEMVSQEYRDELPPQLEKHVDRFISSLKEPRYANPLSANDIASLYQKFYTEFQNKAEVYLREGLNRGSKDFQPLESYQEIASKKKERGKRSTKLRQYVEDAEAKACVMVYNKIFELPFSGGDQVSNEQVMTRTKLLRQIPVTFDHLDFDKVVKEQDMFPLLGNAGKELHNMNDSKTPKLKLEYLLKAHKIIVEGLTQVLPKNTTSADLILPALIYTFIYFDTPNLWLNLQFISRFRNQKSLQGESLYCLTNYEAAVHFLQTLTLSTLGIDKDSVPDDLDVSMLEKEPPSQQPPIADPLSDGMKPKSSPVATKSRSASTSSVNKSRRMSLMHPTDIADQSIKTLGSTINNSYRFFVGKFVANERDDKSTAYPNTLEDARKVVGLDNSSSSSVAQPASSPPPSQQQQQQQHPALQRNGSEESFMNRVSGAVMKFRNEATGGTGNSTPLSAAPNANGPVPKLAPAPADYLSSTSTDNLTLSDVHALHAEYKRMVSYLKSINAFE